MSRPYTLLLLLYIITYESPLEAGENTTDITENPRIASPSQTQDVMSHEQKILTLGTFMHWDLCLTTIESLVSNEISRETLMRLKKQRPYYDPSTHQKSLLSNLKIIKSFLSEATFDNLSNILKSKMILSAACAQTVLQRYSIDKNYIRAHDSLDYAQEAYNRLIESIKPHTWNENLEDAETLRILHKKLITHSYQRKTERRNSIGSTRELVDK